MDDRESVIRDMRNFLDWLEKHPVVPIPAGMTGLLIPAAGKENFLAIAKILGSFEKRTDETYFNLIKKFGTITLEVYEQRSQVCTRRQVGTRKVEEKVATNYEIQEKEVPVYEWECPDSLLSKQEQLSGAV